jgi:hypothetical protein
MTPEGLTVDVINHTGSPLLELRSELSTATTKFNGSIFEIHSTTSNGSNATMSLIRTVVNGVTTCDVTSGGHMTTSSLHMTSGGLDIDAGGIHIKAGGLSVHGGVHIESGGLYMSEQIMKMKQLSASSNDMMSPVIIATANNSNYAGIIYIYIIYIYIYNVFYYIYYLLM